MADASKLHRLAKRIADKLSQGKPPALTPAMAAYIEDRPESVFDSLDGFVRQRGEADEGNPLAAAYLMLMAIQLEHLRYQIDRDYAWAKEMQQEFERRVVSLARAGDLSGRALSMLTGAMREAKLRPGPELIAVNEELFSVDTSVLSTSEDLNASLEQLANDLGDDVFALVDAVDKATAAMPPEIRSVLAGQMAVSPFPNLKEAAPLFVLDPEREVRRGVAETLLRSTGALGPATLRRLIAVRNWLPGDERSPLDQVVREARVKGVTCAGWEAGEATEIRASAIDGAGTQGFMIISPAGGKRQRLSSILLRHGSGVLDAWSAEPSPKREIAEMFDQASATTPLLSVSRDYLDRAVDHHLDIGLENGEVPPVGLLQVAEAIRAPEWRPVRLDWRETLDALIAEVPAPLLRPAKVEEIIETSADWAAIADGVSDSWFEDDQEVDDLLRKARTQQVDRLVERLFSGILERRKLKWAERFLWVALWLKEAPADLGRDEASDTPRPDGIWPQFAILSREMAQGRRVEEIPLMEDIALRTIMAMRG